MARYAGRTKVTADRSRGEIEKTLTRYGATGFMYGWSERGAVIGFMLHGRQYKCTLRLPDESKFQTNARGASVSPVQAKRSYEKSKLQRWRALALVIKAKLEAVESEISTVESEFLPWMVLPNGETVGQWMMPQLDVIYKNGKMPPLLPGGDLIEGEVV
jgi:hypothetical protein